MADRRAAPPYAGGVRTAGSLLTVIGALVLVGLLAIPPKVQAGFLGSYRASCQSPIVYTFKRKTGDVIEMSCRKKSSRRVLEGVVIGLPLMGAGVMVLVAVGRKR